MQNNLNKVERDTDLFLKKFFKKQVKSPLLNSMSYGLFSGGKKIRSKILVDVGKIFDVDYKKLIIVGSAVECIHSYSLIHDDLPCMDNDKLRRGKPTVHIKFGESTAVLAGNSLLTLSSEILTSKLLKLDNSIKINLIKKISECYGNLGIAGGQYLDLSYEKKKILKIEIKKTGKLFSFCCMAPLIKKKKDNKLIKEFDQIGSDIGLLFQIVDDLIDYMGQSSIAGKKTRKDEKQGKATLISLLGYKNAVKYKDNLISNLHKKLSKYGSKSYNLINTLDYIATRNK